MKFPSKLGCLQRQKYDFIPQVLPNKTKPLLENILSSLAVFCFFFAFFKNIFNSLSVDLNLRVSVKCA